MKIVTNILDNDFQKLIENKNIAIAIGKFDGIHLGHRLLLKELLKKKEEGFLSCIFTFDIPPKELFDNSEEKIMSTRDEKREIFEKLGIEVLIEFKLTKESAAILPEIFLKDILVDSLHTKWIIAGHDISYGAKGAGDATLLKECSNKYNYQVILIDKLTYKGQEISSTLIRNFIKSGKLENVRELLGMPYGVKGVVVEGNKLGRLLQIPTANIVPSKEKLLPPCGVYFAKILIGDNYFEGICNIGRKPTIAGEYQLGIEAHIFDYSEDIYGKDIGIDFISFWRREMKFDSVEELKKQMDKDIIACRAYFEL